MWHIGNWIEAHRGWIALALMGLGLLGPWYVCATDPEGVAAFLKASGFDPNWCRVR